MGNKNNKKQTLIGAKYISIKGKKLKTSNSCSSTTIATIMKAANNYIPEDTRKALLRQIEILESKDINFRNPSFLIGRTQQAELAKNKHTREKETKIQDLIDPNLITNPKIRFLDLYLELTSKVDVEQIPQYLGQLLPLTSRNEWCFGPNKWPFGSDDKPELQQLDLDAWQKLNIDYIYPGLLGIHWVPSVFSRTHDGCKFKLVSELNGLLRDQHQELYQTVEAIFNQFVPLFEATLGQQLATHHRLAAIVKMQKYVCASDYYGRWHREGERRQNIVANGIYYFYKDTPLFKTDCLKVSVIACVANSFITADSSIHVQQGMCVVVSNFRGVSHKAVMSLNSTQHDSNCAERKILAFFLVDPQQTLAGDVTEKMNWVYKVGWIASHWARANDVQDLSVVVDLIERFVWRGSRDGDRLLRDMSDHVREARELLDRESLAMD